MGQFVDASQPMMHCPFTHTRSRFCESFPHWLENWQVFEGAVQVPAWHVRPPEQSVDTLHGHGPFDPPHAVHAPEVHALPAPHCWNDVHDWGGGATHLFAMQTLLFPQSLSAVHSIGVPASAPGAAQSFPLQTVPCGHSDDAVQVCMQPTLVHTEPLLQPVEPVHGCGVGATSVWQP
jgi:hypothetical protein